MLFQFAKSNKPDKLSNLDCNIEEVLAFLKNSWWKCCEIDDRMNKECNFLFVENILFIFFFFFFL